MSTTHSTDNVTTPPPKLLALGLICSLLQIVGLATTVAGIPVIGAVAGFAAIVSFFLVWSRPNAPTWLVCLTGLAGLCGIGLILMEVSRAL